MSSIEDKLKLITASELITKSLNKIEEQTDALQDKGELSFLVWKDLRTETMKIRSLLTEIIKQS